MTEVLVVTLAGGVGERLFPLTKEVAKPAVPFGGIYRIIDITLSNCINSGLRKIYILTQYKAIMLNRHIRRTWNIVSPELGEFIEILPPTKRISEDWYLGTANAVYQNSQSVAVEGLPYTLILSADHVYKMNYQHLLDWHNQHGADVTVATTQIAPSEARQFGIVDIDSGFRIRGFEEKPKHNEPSRSRFNPEMCSASMGIYLFNTEVLLESLEAANAQEGSSHDFGKDVLPQMIAEGRKVYAFDFLDENRTDIRYWRDIGTLDAFYEANMDLVAITPIFNLYDEKWPIRSAQWPYPPAKFVFAEEGRRMGVGVNSMVCAGCIVSGGRVVNSILSPGVRVNSYSEVEFSILFPHVNIGRHSRIRRAIIDADLDIEEHTEIGFDPVADQRAGHCVTESGIVIVHAGSPGVHSNKGNHRQDSLLGAAP
jgi:glucose-1-phosphate adenylyltransferase